MLGSPRSNISSLKPGARKYVSRVKVRARARINDKLRVRLQIRRRHWLRPRCKLRMKIRVSPFTKSLAVASRGLGLIT